jgi:excisionase family DNA binding protein
MLTENPDTRILTIREVADLLRVHRSTVSRYAMSGDIKSYLIGNRRLFKESDVWAFFDNQVALESAVARKETGWQQ